MPDAAPPTRDEIIDLERSYWEAMKAKDGGRTAELSGDPSLVTGARGVMTIAKAAMGKMTEAGDWKLNAYALEDLEVVTPAPNVAIVAYTVRQNMTMNGISSELRAAESSTWIRGGDGWECHAHSETFLDDASGA